MFYILPFKKRLITGLRPTRCRQACKILSLCTEGLHLIFPLLLLLLQLFLLRKDVTLQSPRRLPGTQLISTLKTPMRGRSRDFDPEDCRTLLALALSGVIFTQLVHAHCSWPAPPPPTAPPHLTKYMKRHLKSDLAGTKPLSCLPKQGFLVRGVI